MPSLSPNRSWLVRSRAWIGIAIIAPFAVLALLSRPHSIEGSWVDFEFDSLAWIVFAAGGTIRWWATLYIGGRKKQALICEGPYSLCRNPLYIGTCLCGISLGIFLQSLTFLLGIALATYFYLAVTVPYEELKLREKLGDEYRDYCRRVPRFWPRFATFRTAATIDVNVAGLVAEAWRASRWMLIPLLGHLLCQFRAEAWWPKLLLWP